VSEVNWEKCGRFIATDIGWHYYGCKFLPDASVSVEDCLVAVNAEVCGINIRYSSCMNEAIVIFQSQSQTVNYLIESSLMINEMLLPILSLSSPSKPI